jgi:hypothetical protein
MAKQPETIFKEKVATRLKNLRPWIEADKIQQKSKRGSLDFYICASGTFVVWELKVKKNTRDPLQKWKMDMFSQAKAIVRTVKPDNLEESIKELRAIAGVPEHINDREKK